MSESTARKASWNDTVIEQFRAGEQRIVDTFDRSFLLLLHTVGARTGARRTSPLAYLTLDDQLVIVGSAGGRDTHPSWYFNLLAHPEVTFERWRDDAIEEVEAIAVPAEGEEYHRLWAQIAERAPGFDAYRSKTSRQIPVVILKSRT